MKMNSTVKVPDWNISFWFAVSSPLLGVLLGFLVLAIFFDDGGSHEHNANSLCSDHSTVRVRFGRTSQETPKLTVVCVHPCHPRYPRFEDFQSFLKCRSSRA